MLCVSTAKSAGRGAERGVDNVAVIQSDSGRTVQPLERRDAAGSDRSKAARFPHERRRSPCRTWRRRVAAIIQRLMQRVRGVASLVDTPGVARGEARGATEAACRHARALQIKLKFSVAARCRRGLVGGQRARAPARAKNQNSGVVPRTRRRGCSRRCAIRSHRRGSGRTRRARPSRARGVGRRRRGRWRWSATAVGDARCNHSRRTAAASSSSSATGTIAVDDGATVSLPSTEANAPTSGRPTERRARPESRPTTIRGPEVRSRGARARGANLTSTAKS